MRTAPGGSDVDAGVRTARASVADRVPDPRSPQHRLGVLFDRGRWVRLSGRGTGVVGARGLIGGRPAHAYCCDPADRGGALSIAGCADVVTTIDTARAAGTPVVGLWHSGGARLDQGVEALEGVGALFSAIVRASGVIPQISVILGPAAGGAAYGPALTDIVIADDAARMFVTGPDVIRRVTGEQVDMRRLGGPEVHDTLSGVAHVVAADTEQALGAARLIASLLSTPDGSATWTVPDPQPALRTILPQRAVRAYNVRPLVRLLLDDDGIELQSGRAPNVVTHLGRLGGRTVGVLANNPIRKAGCLTADASEKAARFVRTCDAFGVPLVVVVDVPGYLPGVDEEHAGVLRHGAKLLHAFAGARTPRVTVITRKAFGGAYLAMNARSMGAHAVFAWPSADVAVMGAEAAVEIVHRRTLAAVEDEDGRQLLRRGLVAAQHEIGSLARLVDSGVLDAVIDPAETPTRVAAALQTVRAGRSDQRNIPL